MSTRLNFRHTPTLRLLRAVVEANQRLLATDEAEIRTFGLSTSEFDCLVTLGVDQPLRMCDLAERSLLTKSHTTQVAKGLEARGLVHRRRSPESDREVLVSLTPEGQELFERVYPALYEHLKRDFDSRLTGAEQETLIALLRKVADGG